MPADLVQLRETVRADLRAIGFDRVGFASPEPAADAAALLPWLREGRHAGMEWMARDPGGRIDPRRRFPWVRTIVCCALSYATSARARGDGAGDGRGWISRYAWGRDYHKGMRRRLRRACEVLRAAGATQTRPYVDTGPLLERSLHQSAGTGWIGKNSCLIHREIGSWTFLGEVVTDLALPRDRPATDHCGSCTACLEACPTGALVAPGELDSRLCISYQTIENRGPVAPEVRAGLGDHLFGCDVCQEVCPWNAGTPVPDLEEFRPREGNVAPELEGLATLSEEEFHRRFAGTAVRRARYDGFLRNVCVALGNASVPGSRRPLERLAAHPSAQVRAHAAWALARLRKREVTRA
jgi:epoxyqueuosine reductase